MNDNIFISFFKKISIFSNFSFFSNFIINLLIVLPIPIADEIQNENTNMILSNYSNFRHSVISEEMDQIKEIVEDENN
jgi:hypothetical protein